jgi:hypothetical protein
MAISSTLFVDWHALSAREIPGAAGLSCSAIRFPQSRNRRRLCIGGTTPFPQLVPQIQSDGR